MLKIRIETIVFLDLERNKILPFAKNRSSMSIKTSNTDVVIMSEKRR